MTLLRQGSMHDQGRPGPYGGAAACDPTPRGSGHVPRTGAAARAGWLAPIALLLLAGPAVAQSSRSPGVMGSPVYEGGTTFRVWAPNASQVWVTGDFNHWSTVAHPLVREPGREAGIWSIDVDGAEVGDHYRYVIETPGFGTVQKRDPYARVVDSSNYAEGKAIIYDPAAFDWGGPNTFRPPGVQDLIIYELHIGTFVDPTGVDGPPGNFRTAIAAVPYLADLGVTAIEVLPVNEFIGRFSGGYNPADLFAVENAGYGGPDAFKAFVKACHEHEIAVILDVVYNHWGPWDVATHQFDAWHTDRYPGGIYFYDADRINSPWGPRPNYDVPRVRRYIFDNLRMWLEEYRVSGFRWDSTCNIYDTNSTRGTPLPAGWRLLQDANRLMDRFYPHAINIAEDIWSGDIITATVADGGAGFDAQWHFFVSHVRNELKKDSSAEMDMLSVRYGLRHSYNNGNYGRRVIFTESHNEICCGNDRLTIEIDPENPESWKARKRSTLGAALLFTAPGIPMIYQGQEFLDQTPFDQRRPIDWNALRTHPGIRALYRDLIHLRRDLVPETGEPAGVAGLRGAGLNVYHTNNSRESKLIAYHRWDDTIGNPGVVESGHDCIVVANFSDEPLADYAIGFPLGGRWTVRFNSDAVIYGSDFTNLGPQRGETIVADGPPADGMPTSAMVTIGPSSVIVLSLPE